MSAESQRNCAFKSSLDARDLADSNAALRTPVGAAVVEIVTIYCHGPRDRDNHFPLSQVYSNFLNYMHRTFSLSPLYYIIILCCYGHVTRNRVCL
jgi:hypothetical protein